MARKQLAGAFAVAAFCVATTAALAQSTPPVVRIQDYPGIGNMLFRIAAARGYCEQHGIKCELQMIPSGPLGVQALLAKSIDVGLCAAGGRDQRRAEGLGAQDHPVRRAAQRVPDRRAQ